MWTTRAKVTDFEGNLVASRAAGLWKTTVPQRRKKTGLSEKLMKKKALPGARSPRGRGYI
jgi:hypothetical protein